MAKFPPEFIEKVREANDIAEVVKEYVPLSASGRNLKGLCPFHSEKTPSFMVNPDRQIFKCFGCGEGGTVINFLMKVQNLEFPKAVEQLAERAGIPLPRIQQDFRQEDVSARLKKTLFDANEFAKKFYHRQLMDAPEGEAARNYLLEVRKLTRPTLLNFQLGFASSDWELFYQAALKKGFKAELLEKAGLIVRRQSGSGFFDRFREQIIFPITDAKNRVIGFGGRFIEKREPKYINSPETPVFIKSHCLYAIDQAGSPIRESKQAILMEGYMDVIMAHQSGVKNVVATLGTALTKDHASILKRYTNDVVLMYDSDKAGLAAALRGLEPLINIGLNVNVSNTPEGKDPDEFVRQKGCDEFIKVINSGKSPMEFALELTVEKYGLASIQAKSSIVEAMKPLLDRLSKPVEKELNIRMISDRLNIDKETLLRQYKSPRIKGTQVSRPISDVPMDLRKKDEVQRERELLRLLIYNSQYREPMKSLLEGYPLVFPLYQQILEVLFSLSENKPDENPQAILNYFEDEKCIKIISEILMEDPPNKPEHLFSGFQRKIVLHRLKEKQDILSAQLKEASSSGDLGRVMEIQKQITELKKASLELSRAS